MVRHGYDDADTHDDDYEHIDEVQIAPRFPTIIPLHARISLPIPCCLAVTPWLERISLAGDWAGPPEALSSGTLSWGPDSQGR